MYKQKGFTLIEIMVVVVILGILAALVVPQVMSRPDQAKVTVAQGDIKAIAAALDMYRLDNHVYPSTQQGLDQEVDHEPYDGDRSSRHHSGALQDGGPGPEDRHDHGP